jgi:hypothetical protein
VVGEPTDASVVGEIVVGETVVGETTVVAVGEEVG